MSQSTNQLMPKLTQESYDSFCNENARLPDHGLAVVRQFITDLYESQIEWYTLSCIVAEMATDNQINLMEKAGQRVWAFGEEELTGIVRCAVLSALQIVSRQYQLEKLESLVGGVSDE